MSLYSTESQEFIHALVEELEVSEERYIQAERSYKSFGEWTQREESSIRQYDPEVYVQGSFRLGTAIKPSNQDGEYDIDLVCVLNELSKSSLTQQKLKVMLEQEVQSYREAKGIKKPVAESRRCWTLKYADGAQFHMDILPALPNAESQRFLLDERGLDASFADTAIAITDYEHMEYQSITDDWPRSNPKGYGEWFKSRMVKVFENIRKSLAEEEVRKGIQASVEDIPEYRVRTPLQQAIMILKRHRDDMFEKEQDIKPISVIITTLSAHAYKGETDVGDALFGILNRMTDYIQLDGENYIIVNPTDSTENFADKWKDHPERKDAFFSWVTQVRSDFSELAKLSDFKAMAEEGTITMSSDLKKRALNRIINRTGTASLLGAATVAPSATDSDYSFSNAPRTPKTPRDFA